MAYNEL